MRIAAVGVLLHTVGGDCGTMAKLIFAGMAVSEVFSVLLLSLLFRRERGEAHRTAVRVDAALARQFAAIAIPLSLSALAANLLSAAGSVILPRRLMAAGLDAEQALAALGTLSGMVLPLMLLPSALIGSIGTALLPIVTAAHATGNRARVRALVGRAVMTVGLIGIPATAVLIPLAPSLSLLLFAQPLTLRYAALTWCSGSCHVLPDDHFRPAERTRIAESERSDRRSGGIRTARTLCFDGARARRSAFTGIFSRCC